jgi:hypothetical protein
MALGQSTRPRAPSDQINARPRPTRSAYGARARALTAVPPP